MIIKLSIMNLTKMIKKNSHEFFLIVLVQTVAFLCVLMSYGIFQNILKVSNEITMQNKTFDVDLIYETSDDNERLYQSIDFSIFNEKFQNIINSTNNKWYSYSCYGYVIDDELFKGVCAFDLNFSYRQSDTDNNMSAKEIFDGDRVVAVNYSSVPCQIGEMVQIGKEMYSVVDTDELTSKYKQYYNAYVIPYKSISSDCFKMRRFKITMTEIPTKDEISNIAKAIEENFGYKISIEVPTIPDLMTEQTNNMSFLFTLIIVFFLICNISFLHCYIYEKRSHHLFVYELLGCTNLKSVIAFINEIFIISSISSILGTIIFTGFIVTEMAKYFSVFETIFSTHTFLLLYIIFTMIEVLILSIRLFISNRNDLITKRS